jgi:transcriptional regulator with XRE-family HTH domain
VTLDTEHFFDRVCDAMGLIRRYGINAEIARKLDISKTAVGYWAEGKVPGADALKNLLKISESSGASLHWLLTGEGPKFVNKPINDDSEKDPVLAKIEDASLEKQIENATLEKKMEEIESRIIDRIAGATLEAKINEAVTLALKHYNSSELNEKKKNSPQDLGDIDTNAFDVEGAVNELNDPREIMRKWFSSEGREYPEDFGVIFFQGWAAYAHEEKIDAVRDAKKVLDRTLKKK